MASAQSFRSIVGIPPSTASTSDSTLIIIDAQNEYATGKLHVEGVETSRTAIASVLEKYRAAKAPIVHVTHDTPQGAPVFTPGTDLAKEFEELTPKEGESVVRKQHPGSFTGTQLQEILAATGRGKVVITGYMVRSRKSTKSKGARGLISLIQPHRLISVFPPRLARLLRGAGTRLWSRMPLTPGTSLAPVPRS